MKPNTLYIYTISAFALLSSDFGGYFSDSDSDGENFRIAGLDDNFTDNEMKAFNKGLDNSLDVINEAHKLALKRKEPELRRLIESKPKPEKLSAEKWEEIKQKMISNISAKLFKEISYKHFKGYGNFITDAGSMKNDTMTNYAGADMFEIPDSYYESKTKTESESANQVANELADKIVSEKTIAEEIANITATGDAGAKA